MTQDQLRSLIDRYGPAVHDMILEATPDGLRLGAMDPARVKEITKMLGGKMKVSGTPAGNYLPNNWQTQRVGQGYFDAIRTMGTEKFDAFAPGMAERLRGLDARFAKDTGGRFTLSPVLDEVRAVIAGEGFAGLERLAKKYGLPVAALAAGLAELQGDAPPESPQ